MDGEGKMTYSNGDTYSGSFLENRRHGMGEMKYKESSNIYKGKYTRVFCDEINLFLVSVYMTLRESQRTHLVMYVITHSFNSIIIPIQSCTGEWVNSKRHGKGHFTYIKEGDTYDGDWFTGMATGTGTKKYSNGNIYEGDFLNGEKHGEGVLIFTDGSKYEGSFKHEKYQGKGKHTYSSGNTYEGDWVDDEKHGFGTFTWIDDGTYIGTFVHGIISGSGTRTHPNGDVYIGEVQNEHKHGQGKMCFANKDIYEGCWVDGKINGHGKYYHSITDETVEGIFRNGIIVGGRIEYPSGCIYEGELREKRKHGMYVLL
jgi:hypothetical protein